MKYAILLIIFLVACSTEPIMNETNTTPVVIEPEQPVVGPEVVEQVKFVPLYEISTEYSDIAAELIVDCGEFDNSCKVAQFLNYVREEDCDKKTEVLQNLVFNSDMELYSVGDEATLVCNVDNDNVESWVNEVGYKYVPFDEVEWIQTSTEYQIVTLPPKDLEIRIETKGLKITTLVSEEDKERFIGDGRDYTYYTACSDNFTNSFVGYCNIDEPAYLVSQHYRAKDNEVKLTLSEGTQTYTSKPAKHTVIGENICVIIETALPMSCPVKVDFEDTLDSEGKSMDLNRLGLPAESCDDCPEYTEEEVTQKVNEVLRKKITFKDNKASTVRKFDTFEGFEFLGSTNAVILNPDPIYTKQDLKDFISDLNQNRLEKMKEIHVDSELEHKYNSKVEVVEWYEDDWVIQGVVWSKPTKRIQTSTQLQEPIYTSISFMRCSPNYIVGFYNDKAPVVETFWKNLKSDGWDSQMDRFLLRDLQGTNKYLDQMADLC